MPKYGKHLAKPGPQDYDYCLEAVKYNGCHINLICDQTEELCIIAVRTNADAYRYIRKPSRELQAKLISIDPYICSFLEMDNHLTLVKISVIPKAFRELTDINDDLIIEALKRNGEVLQYLDDPTEGQ